MLHHIWRLSEPGQNNLGLACSEEGLLLGRTALLERRDERFVAREADDIRRLLSRAYQMDVEATPFLSGLATVAAALNAKDLLLARIAAVHLRIPDLPDEAARERLEAEDRLIKSADSDWDPAEHPRAGTPPNPGWFALTDGGSDEDSDRTRVADNSSSTQQSDASSEPPDDRVKLPDSDDDIDELHDLLEWIANAKPEDEAAIRAEIKKRFYDVGDTAGGDALNRALSDSLEVGNNKKARQEILDSIALLPRTTRPSWGSCMNSSPACSFCRALRSQELKAKAPLPLTAKQARPRPVLPKIRGKWDGLRAASFSIKYSARVP